MDKQLLGIYGEIIASRYLREHGYILLSAHYSCRLGEIDLIVSDKKHICFVEVKTRSENMRYAPADAVDFAKRKRIIALLIVMSLIFSFCACGAKEEKEKNVHITLECLEEVFSEIIFTRGPLNIDKKNPIPP